MTRSRDTETDKPADDLFLLLAILLDPSSIALELAQALCKEDKE